MSIETEYICVGGLEVQIDRKAIKNLHIGVYPPDGRIRVAAPLAVENEAVRLAIIEKLGWLKRQRSEFQNQARQSEREMLERESHFYLGRRYLLRLVEATGTPRIVVTQSALELHARPDLSADDRRRMLSVWYRRELRKFVSPLVEKWSVTLELDSKLRRWGIKRMKTRWGSCNDKSGRIWLNLELIKKPPACIEYVLVHELLHLLERGHGRAFVALLDRHIPRWRTLRDELNAAPLAHEEWDESAALT